MIILVNNKFVLVLLLLLLLPILVLLLIIICVASCRGAMVSASKRHLHRGDIPQTAQAALYYNASNFATRLHDSPHCYIILQTSPHCFCFNYTDPYCSSTYHSTEETKHKLHILTLLNNFCTYGKKKRQSPYALCSPKCKCARGFIVQMLNVLTPGKHTKGLNLTIETSRGGSNSMCGL